MNYKPTSVISLPNLSLTVICISCFNISPICTTANPWHLHFIWFGSAGNALNYKRKRKYHIMNILYCIFVEMLHTCSTILKFKWYTDDYRWVSDTLKVLAQYNQINISNKFFHLMVFFHKLILFKNPLICVHFSMHKLCLTWLWSWIPHWTCHGWPLGSTWGQSLRQGP